MFKFEKYPDIYEAYEEYARLVAISYKYDVKHENTRSEKHEKLFWNAFNKARDYKVNIYSKIIFNSLVKERPNIHYAHRKIREFDEETQKFYIAGERNEYDSWDTYFEEGYDMLTDEKKKILPCLIEEEGLYRLHADYYDDRKRWSKVDEEDWTRYYRKMVKQIAKEDGAYFEESTCCGCLLEVLSCPEIPCVV